MAAKRVGFFIRHFGDRGTEVAVYDYADCNEEILNNKSIIIHFPKYVYEQYGYPFVDSVFEKFKNRFEMIEVHRFSDVNTVCKVLEISHFYMLTAGDSEPPAFQACIHVPKFLVHCVFHTTNKYGDVYGPISQQVNTKCGTTYPVVPHMVRVDDTTDDLRAELNIPKGATVFGRYGGIQQFDISYVKEAVVELARILPCIFYL